MDSMRSLRTVSLILVYALACRCNSAEKTTLCFLDTITETSIAGTTSSTFTFSESRPVSQVTVSNGVTYTRSFDYNGAGQLLGYTTVSTAGNTSIGYFYDSQRKLIKSVEVSDNGTLTIDFLYNVHLQVITASHVFVGPGGDYTMTETFAYPDEVTRNPATVTRVHSGGATIVATYLYDDKINPVRGILPTTLAVNNIVSETVDGVTRTFSYVYNGEGYPVSATVSDGSTRSWTYDCKEI